MAGKPGVGGWNMPSSSSIKQADFDTIEWYSPVTPPANSVAVSTQPNRVDFQFAGTVDDAAGKGMSYYMLYRRVTRHPWDYQIIASTSTTTTRF